MHRSVSCIYFIKTTTTFKFSTKKRDFLVFLRFDLYYLKTKTKHVRSWSMMKMFRFDLDVKLWVVEKAFSWLFVTISPNYMIQYKNDTIQWYNNDTIQKFVTISPNYMIRYKNDTIQKFVTISPNYMIQYKNVQ